MITDSLNGVWKARNVKDDYWFNAQVPGTILAALIENNLTQDPYYRDNEKKGRELFKDDYEYIRTFNVTEEMLSKENVELVCMGLDTLAEIYINDEFVADTDNMHRTWRIPIKDFVAAGPNAIRIVFRSALEFIAHRQPTPGKEIHFIPSGCREGNQYLRKSHSQFGWDWGPQLPDCGIWRDIQIEAYDVRISKLSIGQNYLEEGIEVLAYVETEGLPFREDNGEIFEGRYALLATLNGPYEFSADADCEIKYDGAHVLRILVEEPQLWWPNGYGPHPLYELTVRLIEKDRTFGGNDIERYVSHKKVFERYDEGKDTSDCFVPEDVTFADLLGIKPSVADNPSNEMSFASNSDSKSTFLRKSIDQDDDGFSGDDDWFSARAAIGGNNSESTLFEKYSGHSAGNAIGHDSDEGLFSIAIDDSYGHSADQMDEHKFDSEIGMGPFDNMTVGEGLFGKDYEKKVVHKSYAEEEEERRRAKEAEVRKYEKPQKSILRSAAVSVKDEMKIGITAAKAMMAAQNAAMDAEMEANMPRTIIDENGVERELTNAEMMLQRMMVRKDMPGGHKQSYADTSNMVTVVDDVAKVKHVSIDDTEEGYAEEEFALKAVAFKQTEEHKSAGQLVVSDTDTVMWLLDSKTKKIGLRSITVSQEQDAWGEEFAFCVNGVKIFAMGGNYVPQDAIYEWNSVERMKNLIQDCVRSNFNCIRVWGGGYYPSDEFYDLCDHYGLIVWQDAMFASNVYDVSEEFEFSVSMELHDNLERLHHHASLGLICGNSEIESAWIGWEGFANHSQELRDDYLRLFEKVIPQVVAEESPMTFYWSSSPSSFGKFKYPDDENHGDVHYWDMWHGQKPLEEFNNHYYRFCSEFGFQSYPDIRTLDSFTRETDRNLFSKIMDSHQKDNAGNNKLFFYMSEQFLFPKDYESGIYLSQALQGIAVKRCVEHMRRNRGRCMGALYWQINDCWPGISWSGIDYFGRWKALQYMATRFYAPVAGSIKKEGRVMTACLQNETMFPVRYKVTMNLKDLEFNVIDTISSDEIIVDALSAKELLTRDYTELSAGRSGVVFVEAEFLNLSTGDLLIETETILPYKYLKLENPELGVFVMEDGEKFIFYLQASKFAPFVEIYLKGMDAIFGDNFFNMTKPEHKIFLYKRNFNSEGVTLEDIKERLIIRSLYDSYSYD